MVSGVGTISGVGGSGILGVVGSSGTSAGILCGIKVLRRGVDFSRTATTSGEIDVDLRIHEDPSRRELGICVAVGDRATNSPIFRCCNGNDSGDLVCISVSRGCRSNHRC